MAEGRTFSISDPVEHAGRELHPSQGRLQQIRKAPIGALKARLLASNRFAQQHSIAAPEVILKKIEEMPRTAAERSTGTVHVLTCMRM